MCFYHAGKTYRLRITNAGLKTSLNFRIQGHKMLLVEAEGSYTLKQDFASLDIHVGQTYSVLVTATQPGRFTYRMVACTRFVSPVRCSIAHVNYAGSKGVSPYKFALPHGPRARDYDISMNQARSIRLEPVS